MLALALALVALAAPSSASALSISDKNTLEASVVARINTVRRDYGLRPLTVADRLANAADRHAESMAYASYFAHELFTPDRSTRWTSFGTWIRWYWPGPGYSSWSAGENLAWGAPGLGVRKTVSLWMHSPGHRANLLSKDWNRIGVSIAHFTNPVGYYKDYSGATITTADFGHRAK